MGKKGKTLKKARIPCKRKKASTSKKARKRRSGQVRNEKPKTESNCTASGIAESVSTGVWCVPGFGAGFEIALEPSKLQKEGENPGKGHFCLLRQTLVCAKPWFKRDLMESRKIDSESPSESHPINAYSDLGIARDSESLDSRFRIADSVPLSPVRPNHAYLPGRASRWGKVTSSFPLFRGAGWQKTRENGKRCDPVCPVQTPKRASGPKWEKNPPKGGRGFWPHRTKGEKTRKMQKWPFLTIFGPIFPLQPFFPLFPGGAKIYFRPFFFPIWGLCRAIGIAREGGGILF